MEAVEHSNVDAIVQLVEPERLQELHCTLAKLNSTAFQPSQDRGQDQLAFLEDLYGRLREAHERTKNEHLAFLREGQLTDDRHPEVFFNYVQLNFSRPFADYHFEKPLIDLHYRNIVQQDLPLVPCRSVSELNYLDLFDSYCEDAVE